MYKFEQVSTLDHQISVLMSEGWSMGPVQGGSNVQGDQGRFLYNEVPCMVMVLWHPLFLCVCVGGSNSEMEMVILK